MIEFAYELIYVIEIFVYLTFCGRRASILLIFRMFSIL